MGPHSVTCHLAAVTFQLLPQPKLVLDLCTLEGCKAEFYIRSTGQLKSAKFSFSQRVAYILILLSKN